LGSYRGKNVSLIWEGVTTAALAKAMSVSFEINTNIKGYYEAARRLPERLEEGNVEITGTLSRLWIDLQMLSYIDKDPGTLLQEEFNIIMQLVNVPNPHQFKLIKCKLGTLKVSTDAEGYVTEDVDFTALAYSWA